MRVVLDTNTVVSGLLWDNQPRAIIIEQMAREAMRRRALEELK